MKRLHRPTLLLLFIVLLSTLSGCGVDKFFITRAVNKIDTDILDQLEDFATLNDAQNAQAQAIATISEQWIRQETLPKVAGLIEQVAHDVESSGQLHQSSYDEIIEFFYQPLPLSKKQALISELASFFYNMSPEQDTQVREQLINNYEERKEERDGRDIEDQKRGIAKTLKTIFRGMDAARSHQQLDEMREILNARIDLSAQTHDYYLVVNQKFLNLTQDKGDSLMEFTQRYTAAWQALEAGPNSAHPIEFKHNADNGFKAINHLFATLNEQERIDAATVIREYQQFFLELAQAGLAQGRLADSSTN